MPFFIFLIVFFSLPASAETIIPDVVVKDFHLTTAQKTVITREEMDTIGATNLMEALQTLGGIQLHDTTGNGSQVLLSIRGFGANANSNTLLMVNGIPITNPDIAPVDLNAIPFYEIDYIEVISGSESVLHGDQAVGGTINIVTRRQKKEDIMISCGVGSYHQSNCYGAISRQYHGLNMAIGLSTQHTDNYREHNNYAQTQLSGQLEYPYSTGRLEFLYTLANEKMQYPGALSVSQVEENRRQANNESDFFNDWNGFFDLRWIQQWNAEWNLETDLVRREMHGNGVLFSPFTQSRVVNLLIPQLKGMIRTAEVTAGLELESDTYQLNTDFGVTDDALQQMGIFGLMSIPFYDRFTFSVGARGAKQYNQLTQFSDIDTINSAFTTTVGVAYIYSPDLNFYLRRAGSFRFPKADEIAFTTPGQVGLKTEHGASYETGVEWRMKIFLSKLSLYQLNLVDEIAFDPMQTPEDPFGTNRNLPPTLRRGFSISEAIKATDKLLLSGQYNFVNARFQSGVNEGKHIPLVSENALHAAINYAFTSRWNVFLEGIFTGYQFAANDDANVLPKVPGFALYNLNLRYQYRTFSANFRVNNLFDIFYNYYTVAMSDQEFFYPAPGRNFLLTLKYSFE